MYALYCTLAKNTSFYIIYLCHQVKNLGKPKATLEEEYVQGSSCDCFDVDRAYISNIENGRMNPTLSTLEKIANALNFSANF